MEEANSTTMIDPPGVMIMPPGCERYDEAVELLGDETLKICRVYAPEIDTIGLVVLFNDWERRFEAATLALLIRPARDDTRTVPVAIYVGDPKQQSAAEMIAVRVWIPLTEGGYGDGAGGHHHFVGSGGNGFGDSWEGIDGDGTGFGLARGSRVVDNDVD